MISRVELLVSVLSSLYVCVRVYGLVSVGVVVACVCVVFVLYNDLMCLYNFCVAFLCCVC